MSELPKVSQQLSDPISENLQKLATLFPAVVKDGELDIEALREELGDFAEIQPGDEKYELNWAGKQAAKKEAFQPLLGKTLKFVKEDSRNPETTENLYIEGDNLETLKLLRQNYYGAVKMIYIDPPYNTGNDFVYSDKFTSEMDESNIQEGITKDSGERLIKNEKSSNRFHASWLDMMYSRIRLSKELLLDDGLVFISIDDGEYSNLKSICDEILGQENFVDCIIWKKRYGGGAKEKYLITVHEQILIYAKNINKLPDIHIPLTPESIKRYYKLKDSNYAARGPYRTHPLEATKSMGERPNLVYSIPSPDGGSIYPKRQWLWGKDRAIEAAKNNELEFIKNRDDDWSVHTKQYLRDENGVMRKGKAFSLIDDIYTQHGTNEIIDLFGNAQIFSFPKPSELIRRLLQIGTGEHSKAIVVDFFSGSASTAHAVMKSNAEDANNLKHIMVQWPEACAEKSEAAKAGYKTIAEIGKERIRRAGDKIKAELVEKHKALLNEDGELELDDKSPETNPYILNPDSLDIGFKAFRIEDTQINWLKKDLSGGELVDADISSKDQLDFVPDFTDLDVVYEIMLRQSSIPLTQPISTLTDIGSRTYLYGESYLICLEEDITKAMVEQLAQLEPTPLKFIFRDSAFGKDIAFKDETFRRLNAEIAKHTDGAESYTVEFI